MVSENTDDGDGRIVNDGESDGVTRRDALRAGATLAAAAAGSSLIGGRVSAQTTSTPLGGSGTDADPYVIESIEGLDAVRNDLSAHYKLTSDIDASGTDPFDPIGGSTEGNRFTGVFNGNGNTVTGLSITDTANTYTALFRGLAETGVIRDITIEDAVVDAGEKTAVVAGWCAGTIEDVTLTNATVTSTQDAGTLAAILRPAGTIERVCVDATLNGRDSENTLSVAGVVAEGHGTLRKCSVDVTITAVDSGAAGVATTWSGEMRDVTATVDITCAGSVAGVAHQIREWSTGTVADVRRVSVNGTVETDGWDSNAAGFAAKLGAVEGTSPVVVRDARASVDVHAIDGDRAAGFSADNYTADVSRVAVLDATVQADASGTIVFSGVGENASDLSVSAAYVEDSVAPEGAKAHDTTSNIEQSTVTTDAVTGTVAEDTLAEFNFEDTWDTTETYPVLRGLSDPAWCGTEIVPPGGGVTSDGPGLEWLPWGIAGLIGLGLVADDDGEGGGE